VADFLSAAHSTIHLTGVFGLSGTDFIFS